MLPKQFELLKIVKKILFTCIILHAYKASAWRPPTSYFPIFLRSSYDLSLSDNYSSAYKVGVSGYLFKSKSTILKKCRFHSFGIEYDFKNNYPELNYFLSIIKNTCQYTDYTSFHKQKGKIIQKTYFSNIPIIGIKSDFKTVKLQMGILNRISENIHLSLIYSNNVTPLNENYFNQSNIQFQLDLKILNREGTRSNVSY